MTTGGVVTLTMNPALDLSTEVDVVVPFLKLRCGAMRRDPGGGGINVARVVTRLGGRARAVLPVGGCVGQLLLQLVAAEGVANVALPIAEETREDFTVFERKTGNQFRFVEPGPKLARAEWEGLLDTFAAEAKDAAYAVISGSLPPGVPDSFFATAAERMKALGIPLALDTTGAGLRAAFAHGVAVAKPNKREFEELAGLEAPSPEQLAAAARDLVAQRNVGAVALTLAEDGAILATRDAAWRAKAPEVKAVSTVGAGDSFLGAMIWSLTEGHDWPEAFRLGVAAGTAALLSPGTDLAHRRDVEIL